MSIFKVIGIASIISSVLVLSSCSFPTGPKYPHPLGWEERTKNKDKDTIVYIVTANGTYKEVMGGPSHCFSISNGILHNRCVNIRPSPVWIARPIGDTGIVETISGTFILVQSLF